MINVITDTKNLKIRSYHAELLSARTREQDGGCWSQKSNVQLTVVHRSQTMSEDGHEDVREGGVGVGRHIGRLIRPLCRFC